MKFENVAVYNFMNALRGMRNSYGSWDKMDSKEMLIGDNPIPQFTMGVNDHNLAMTLSKAGSDHGKFLRQIFVSADIIAPDYFWAEEATYKVGTTENSSSTMHTFGKAEVIENETYGFDNPEDPFVQRYMELINEVKDEWHKSGKKQRTYEWRRLIQLNAKSFLYRRTFTGNYQVLKNMYHSRKNHRLTEWHEFCAWVESLPFSELITLKEQK